MDLVTRTTTNNRKIPEAVFIENVEDFINKHTVQRIMESLQEAYQYERCYMLASTSSWRRN